MAHRDEKLDSMIGKRVTVTLFDTSTYTGLLSFDESQDRYKLKNVVNERRGFPDMDVLFRKSHVTKIEAKGA